MLVECAEPNRLENKAKKKKKNCAGQGQGCTRIRFGNSIFHAPARCASFREISSMLGGILQLVFVFSSIPYDYKGK
jgi:hypothetical protein